MAHTGGRKRLWKRRRLRAASEIASRFPLSHNLCCYGHLAVRDHQAQSGRAAACATRPIHSKHDLSRVKIRWPDFR